MYVNNTVWCPGQCDMDILFHPPKNELDLFFNLWGRQWYSLGNVFGGGLTWICDFSGAAKHGGFGIIQGLVVHIQYVYSLLC